jgi:hypothetical protein
MRMNKFSQLLGLAVLAVAVLWALTAPGWFASGRIGRALTNLDIWAQIHLPYPVLTLLLMGIFASAAIVWFLRHSREEDPGIWSQRR